MNSNVVAAHVRQTFSYHFPVYWFSQELSENACRANGIQKGGGGLMSLKKIAEIQRPVHTQNLLPYRIRSFLTIHNFNLITNDGTAVLRIFFSG